MNKNLVELFLSYCERGISIDFKNKVLELPTKFLSKFSWEIKNDRFVIYNELEEGGGFIINNLDQCQVREYDEYIEIHKDGMEIIIEEMV